MAKRPTRTSSNGVHPIPSGTAARAGGQAIDIGEYGRHWGWDAPGLKELMSQIHFVTACTFITLITLHVAAALKHRFVDRDGIFERMFPLFLQGGNRQDVATSSRYASQP